MLFVYIISATPAGNTLIPAIVVDMYNYIDDPVLAGLMPPWIYSQPPAFVLQPSVMLALHVCDDIGA